MQGRIDNFFLLERNALPKKGNLQYSKRVQSALEKVVGRKTATHDAAEVREAAAAGKAVKRSAGESTAAAASKKASKRVKKTGSDEKPQSQKAAQLPPQPKVTTLQSEAEKKVEAKKRAVEIFKKSQAKKKRQKGNEVKRKVLNQHNLSESDSD